AVYNRIKNADETRYFPLHLMAKDLAYAQQEGSAHGFRLRTADAAFAIFRGAIDHGDGDRDLSAVARQFTHPAALA
ncbi:MAG: NAD-binding protein, partial [Opitutaceae bacterium]